MATSTLRLHLSLTILISFLSIYGTARPCKTLFFTFTTTTTTTYYSSLNQNPNFPLQNPRRFSPFIYLEIRQLPTTFIDVDVEKRPEPYASSVSDSVRDRTKDIMSVVMALLFGVGCGALTAVTVFFIWSVFSSNRFEVGDSDDDYDDVSDNGDDVGENKMGYVAIPDESAAKEVV